VNDPFCEIAELNRINKTCGLRPVKTRMHDQSGKRKEGKEPYPGLVLSKTTVIVLVIRGRPVYDDCHLQINCAGILAICPGSDKAIIKDKDEN